MLFLSKQAGRSKQNSPLEALAWDACAYNTVVFQLLSGCLFQIQVSIMTFYSCMRYYLLSYVCGCLVGFFSQEFEKT